MKAEETASGPTVTGAAGVLVDSCLTRDPGQLLGEGAGGGGPQPTWMPRGHLAMWAPTGALSKPGDGRQALWAEFSPPKNSR